MKYWIIVLIAAGIGGVVLIMNKKVIAGVIGALTAGAVAAGSRIAGALSRDSSETGASEASRPRCAAPSIAARRAEAIVSQNAAMLAEFALPDAEEILRLEAEAERLKNGYYAALRVRQAYLNEAGILAGLTTIVGLSEYIPEGLRLGPEGAGTLPLHSAVWNTQLNGLRRKSAELMPTAAELERLLSPVSGTVNNEPRRDELLAEVRGVLDAYRQRPSNENTEALLRAVSAYTARRNAARESIAGYSQSVSDGMLRHAADFCRAFEALLGSASCQALAAFDAADGEPVTMEMDFEDVTLSAPTRAYWEKLCLFAAEARKFMEQWSEDSFH